VDRAEATQYAGDVGFLPTDPGPDSKEFSMRTSLSSASTEAHLSRRTFLAATTAAVTLGGASRSVPVARALGAEPRPEWRNKHEGMAYRQLGRTGMMISEVVCGGDPIKLDNYKHLELALEMGLNYLDMAPQYNGGKPSRPTASCWPRSRAGGRRCS
jgi:hypothetical protein